MTVFENLKAKNIDELVDCLAEHYDFDSALWWKWWDENYCSKCESETGYITDFGGEHEWQTPCEFAWCELHDKCRLFPEMDYIPDTKQIIKMWLESTAT